MFFGLLVLSVYFLPLSISNSLRANLEALLMDNSFSFTMMVPNTTPTCKTL
jgi:hypothetical protein